MEVNYQIYDKDFTCATPIFQKFHWGILCCERTTPGEVNAPVAHTGVDLCGRWYLPSSGPGQLGAALPAVWWERLHRFGVFPAPICGCWHNPSIWCWWWQERREQELNWLGTSRARDTKSLERSQQLSHWKPELLWCPLHRWIVWVWDAEAEEMLSEIHGCEPDWKCDSWSCESFLLLKYSWGKDCNSRRGQWGKRFSPITYRKVFEKKKCAFRAKEMEHLFFLAPGCLKILTVEKCTF